MKCIVLFTVFVAVTAVDYYPVRDDINITVLAAQPGGLSQYMDCYLDKGPCSELSTIYRKMIPESIEQACARCTDKLKHQYWHFLQAVKKTTPDDYKAYRQRFDPENKYFDALENELSKYA